MPTRSPELNYSLLRTAVIDADDIGEGFEAPTLDHVVIGQEIAILYEVEIPVQGTVQLKPRVIIFGGQIRIS